jgi:hypothetical protein
MDLESLFRRLVAQNDIILQKNERLLLLIAQRANSQDAELLAEMRKLSVKLAAGSLPTLRTSHT